MYISCRGSGINLEKAKARIEFLIGTHTDNYNVFEIIHWSINIMCELIIDNIDEYGDVSVPIHKSCHQQLELDLNYKCNIVLKNTDIILASVSGITKDESIIKANHLVNSFINDPLVSQSEKERLGEVEYRVAS
nr:hypothetical protein [uncultured Mediterranean phage uvMED]BAR25313.1 hypothetical protein [uncultured Mediterranean phage uvMED]